MKTNSSIIMVVVLVVMVSLVVLANWTPWVVPTETEISEGTVVKSTVFPVISYKVDPLDKTSIRFDGLSSSTDKCVVKSYAWNFGDGDVGTGGVTSHTYSEAGIYTVTLTVSNYSKVKASVTTDVAIIP